MSQNDQNDAPDFRVTKATPLEPGAPVENVLGGQIFAKTFAERKALREKAAKKSSKKQVDDDDTEDKAVKSESTKSRKKT